MFKTNKYEAQEKAIAKLQKDTEKLDNIGMLIITALQYLPEDTLLTLHFHWKGCKKYRNITAKQAIQTLSEYEKFERTYWVRHDYNYDGSKNPAPICLMEISLVDCGKIIM